LALDSHFGAKMITRWDKWYPEDNRLLRIPATQAAKSAAQAFLLREKQLVLDLACGLGRDTFFLESQGLTAVGTDASLNGLRIAQCIKAERGALCEFIAADARQLPFREGSFDGVYCFGLLHEFTDEQRKEADVEDVMGEITRLLRREGILILTVIAGNPTEGLPQVQMFSRHMFEKATRGLQTIEVKRYDDMGCTGRPDYHIWYGMFQR
jgi:ubiquinone/menaquinone biosynthesis C-methylase UbiE